MNIRKLTLSSILVAFFVFCVYSTFNAKPAIKGDGNEYYLITESFLNHGTPDLRQEDISSAISKSEKYGFTIPYILDEDMSGFYYSKFDERYSYHFFVYPLFVVPFKYILELFDANDLFVFHIANLFFCFIALLTVSMINIDYKKKLSLILFAIFGPGVWYLDWSHPEVYTYCLMFVAIACYFSGKKYTFYLLMALASLQNPPVILFSSCVLLSDILIWFKTKRFDYIIISIGITGVSLLPSLFYLYHYDVPNLIVREGYSDFGYISIERVLGLFINPTFGLIVYNSIAVVFFLLSVVFVFTGSKLKILNLLMLGGVLLAVIAGTTTYNWNSGMNNVIRYAVWVYPMLCMVFVINFERNILKLSVFNGLIFCISVLFIENVNHLTFNSLSNFLLKYSPNLLYTDKETFCENTHSKDGYLRSHGADAYPCLAVDNNYNVRAMYTDLDSVKMFDDNHFYKHPGLVALTESKLIDEKPGFVYLSEGFIYRKNFTWTGSQLPTNVGIKIDDMLVSSNDLGFLSFGPYIRLKKGSYKFNIYYSCSNKLEVSLVNVNKCGSWDVSAPNFGILKSGEMLLVNDGKISNEIKIDDRLEKEVIEIRTNYSEDSTRMVIKGIEIEIIR